MKLAQSLMAGFKRFTVAQVPRAENKMANALANLAFGALYPCHVELSIIEHPSIHNTAVLITKSQAGNSWISPYLELLKERDLARRHKRGCESKSLSS